MLLYFMDTKNFIRLLFFCILIAGCKESTEYSIVKIEGKQLPVDASANTDAEIEAYIEPYRASVNAELNAVLAYNKNDMVKTDGDLNTAIGNMKADFVMQEANPVFHKRTGKNIDFVLLNHGGIRAPMPKGDVTMRTAFEVMPFENEVVVVELTGKSIEKMLEYLQKAKTAHPVSGIQITLDSDYQLLDFTIQNEPFNPDKTYFVATNDYLKNGGDNMLFFAEAVSEFYIDYKIRNALIDHFRKTDTIDYKTDNRFIRK